MLGAIEADNAQVTYVSLNVPGVSDLLTVGRYRLLPFSELRGLLPRTLIGEVKVDLTTAELGEKVAHLGGDGGS